MLTHFKIFLVCETINCPLFINAAILDRYSSMEFRVVDRSTFRIPNESKVENTVGRWGTFAIQILADVSKSVYVKIERHMAKTCFHAIWSQYALLP